MATPASVIDRGFARAAAEGVREVPWALYAILACSAAILVGLTWDISWHRTIGRDSFWSPPHVLEQLAALVSGLTCGWLVLRTTLAGSVAERDAAVSFWGFRGPLGAWVCIWGTLMMIASAPFDDWWHDAYGLDVKILSPPHMVLATGMVAVQVGAMLMAVAAQNRRGNSGGASRSASGSGHENRLAVLHAASAGILLGMAGTLILEDAGFPNEMHESSFYILTAIVMPIFLLAAARSSRLRWPATTAAATYMALKLVMLWTLQLVPATARLAPIYNPVTHMVPPPFPLLLVIPALGLDLLLRRLPRTSDWLIAPAAGCLFVALMLAAHWYWADFLLSPGARNWLFGADRWDYNVRLGPWRYEFWTQEEVAPFLKGLGWATLFATLSARVGLGWGKGMARVRR